VTPEERARLAALPAAQIAGLTAWKEAGSEPILGVAAVLAVIRTRLLSHYRGAASIADVCLRPAQFSCWNSSQPTCAPLVALGDRMLSGGLWSTAVPLGERVVLETCLWLASRTLAGEIDSPVGTANHYCRKDLDPLPVWTRPPARLLATIGAHAFWIAA